MSQVPSHLGNTGVVPWDSPMLGQLSERNGVLVCPCGRMDIDKRHPGFGSEATASVAWDFKNISLGADPRRRQFFSRVLRGDRLSVI